MTEEEPKEEKVDLRVNFKAWREAKIGGNFACPNCKRRMVVIGANTTYAYCPKCKKYYLPVPEPVVLPEPTTATTTTEEVESKAEEEEGG